jgi:hypothetical protein
MLTKTTEQFYHSGFKYVCPIAVYRRLDRNFPRYPINLDFYACPKRFAETYHYVTDERLEEALENFAGCVVVISHDRWFIDRIATHILAFEGNSQVHFFEGNYSDYEENKKQRMGDVAPHRVRFKNIS